MKAFLIETSENREGYTNKIYKQYLLIPEAQNLLLTEHHDKTVLINLDAQAVEELFGQCNFSKEVEVSFDLVLALTALKVYEGFYSKAKAQADRLLLNEDVELFFIVGANVF